MRWAAPTLTLLTVLPPATASAGILDSKHNLSASGPGAIRALGEGQVCAFCHIPHSAQAPRALWSRPLSKNQQYVPYESSTLSQTVGQPDGASRLCLSCHDGTIALGRIRDNQLIAMRGTATGGMLPPGRSNLGLDLRHSHPVSMRMPEGKPEIQRPQRPQVQLDLEGKVQCTSCHDPHEEFADPSIGKFLVQDNAYGSICISCHNLRGWDAYPSAHQASLAFFAASDGNPTPYPTVGEAACGACHRSHGGTQGARLLQAPEEHGCLNCHNGRVAQSNILHDFQKSYAHPVMALGASRHDAAEGPDHARFDLPERGSQSPRHVECVDCHNPHAANGREAQPPFVGGALEEVWGIDRHGRRVEAARYEYEICFKCHGDSANQSQAHGTGLSRPIRRQLDEHNLRLAFDPSGPSAHPIIDAPRNEVPGLRWSGANARLMTCSDCHGSEDGTRAPHGSSIPYMLRRPYSTEDNTIESPQTYALCYDCHPRETLLGDTSGFPAHRQHVVDSATPCSACHSPHGIGLRQGSTSRNQYLINFDLAIVRPNRGAIAYESFGPGAGACTLSCHGAQHDATAYPTTASPRLRLLPALR